MRATKEDILHYLQEIKSELQESGIEKIALFGSYANNTENVYSDIDIAISKKSSFLSTHTSYNYFDIISNLKDKIRKKFHRNIDIFDLDSKSSFKQSIEKELIYV